jgi:hypothetical protein
VGGAGPHHDGPHVTMRAALTRPGVEAVMTSDGATDADVCGASVEPGLCPTFIAGDSVGRDHLRAHKVAGRRDRIEARGARRVFLPPDAPDLSPSEPCWAKLKTRWRAAQARTRAALDAAIQKALAAVRPWDARSWFRHGGDAVR